MWITVLGPLRAEVGGAAVDLGGPRQRGVLALLLAHRGAVVPVDRMIEDLWGGEAPARAIASLQAYVSNLRRALEPDRPARAPARLLVSAAPGYALRLDPTGVDAWEFERRVAQARTSEPGRARALLDGALGLWQGPAYAEFADEQWALAETARLTQLHRAARELHTALTLRGEPRDAVPLAEALTRADPLHEEGWRLLALALWATGRRADALASLRRARATLAEELGLDPGPALVELEQAILAQRQEVLDVATGPERSVAEPGPHPAPLPATPTAEETELFVGRTAELATVRAAARSARDGGGVLLVSGEAGSGKSSLLRQIARQLRDDGWLVALGRCPESAGAPPAWAWTEALRGLAAHVAPAEQSGAVAALLGDDVGTVSDNPVSGRFRLHRAVCAWLARAGATTPTAVLLDDIHGADPQTLDLLATAATELAGHPVLLVAAYRSAEAAGAALDEALATLARRSPTRILLGGLAMADLTALVAAECGSDLDSATLTALADRTGGNPFYVKESARLLASEGALVATSEVPEGVRDVLRRRFARLPDAAVAVLRLAAVIGRESDVDLLIHAAEATEPVVLDAVDAGLIAGLLTEPEPGRVRFVHALVRDTLYTDLSQTRRARAHARVAQELQARQPGDPAALAHHYSASAGPASARSAVHYSVLAAQAAQRRYATESGVALLRQAVAALARVADATPDEEVELLGQLMRAEVRAGELGLARQTRDRAVAVAEGSDRADLLLAAYAAWTEPSAWNVRPYGTVDERVVGHLRQLLARDDLSITVRCGLLASLVAELEGHDDPRMVGLADEAEALAERSGDPWLIGLAAIARVREQSAAVDPQLWRAVAARLDALGVDGELPPYLWFADYLRSRAATVEGDIAGFERHTDAAIATARRFGMPEALTVTSCAHAMHAHVRGDFALARQRYRDVGQAMARHGSLHAEDFLAFALLTIDLSEATDPAHWAALAEPVRRLHAHHGPLAGDVAALVLGRAGDLERARDAHRTALRPRPDYFWLAFTTLRATVVALLGEASEAPGVYDELLPHAGLFGGANCTAIAVTPVAQALGDLATLLGQPETARRHYEQAARVARHWGAQHWVDAALDRLAAADRVALGQPAERAK